MRNVELAGRMLQGEVDPHLESGTVEAQILWSGASGRSAEIVRMALEGTGRGTTRDGSGCSGVRCRGIGT